MGHAPEAPWCCLGFTRSSCRCSAGQAGFQPRGGAASCHRLPEGRARTPIAAARSPIAEMRSRLHDPLRGASDTAAQRFRARRLDERISAAVLTTVPMLRRGRMTRRRNRRGRGVDDDRHPAGGGRDRDAASAVPSMTIWVGMVVPRIGAMPVSLDDLRPQSGVDASSEPWSRRPDNADIATEFTSRRAGRRPAPERRDSSRRRSGRSRRYGAVRCDTRQRSRRSRSRRAMSSG